MATCNYNQLGLLKCGKNHKSISTYITDFDKVLTKSGITDAVTILNKFHRGFMDTSTRIKLMEKEPADYATTKQNALKYETLLLTIQAISTSNDQILPPGYRGRNHGTSVTMSASRNPDTMDVDAVSIYALKKLTPEERDYC